MGTERSQRVSSVHNRQQQAFRKGFYCTRKLYTHNCTVQAMYGYGTVYLTILYTSIVQLHLEENFVIENFVL